MNILVLTPVKRLFKGKTEYSCPLAELLRSAGNSVDTDTFLDTPAALEHKLKKAAKRNYELIAVENSATDETRFRSKFAYIINNGERAVQNVPNTKAKTDFKAFFKALKDRRLPPKQEEKTVSYERRKTHVFTLPAEDKPVYTFSYRGTRVAALPKAEAEVFSDLPENIERVFRDNAGEYPEGYSLSERTLKVQTFFQRHFPHKGDSRNELIRKSVMLLAICVFLVSAGIFVYNMYILPMQNAAVQSDIRTIFYQTETDPVTGKKKTKALNWKELKKRNSDIQGWIKINHTKIDYPIVQCKSDNKDYQFYLHHNHLKSPSSYGAIFIDYRSKQAMKSKNVIIHGHHMDDGSMFANLCNYGMYSGNLSFYKKSPVVKISTPKEGTKTYKIISVFKSNVDPSQGEYFDFYCNNFKSKAQFMNYVYNLRIRSLFNCPVSVNENDQLISLVTCSYEFSNGYNTFRTVVVARKVRDNESPTVDVNAASLNKNPVWPQCYYSRYGGTRPTISTFMAEFRKGRLKWYDGSANFKGSEELPTSIAATTQPATEKPKVEKPTAPKKKLPDKFTIHIISRAKTLLKKEVKKGTTVQLPKIKDFKKSGYKYTFTKWKVKGFGSKKYLSRKTTGVVVNSPTKMTAVFKKTKIKTKKKPDIKPTSPPVKPTVKPTEKPTSPPEIIPATEEEEFEEADE